MTARQAKKHLKRQIERLKSDNELMREIIDNSPRMAELYSLYNQPCDVTYHTMDFEKKCIERVIPPYMADIRGYEEHMERALITDIAEAIKDNVEFETMDLGYTKGLRATIYLGKVR